MLNLLKNRPRYHILANFLTMVTVPFKGFSGWQVGYSGFTYHISSKTNLIRYVENQREHHKLCSFKEELKDLLKEHLVGFDEDYLIT